MSSRTVPDVLGNNPYCLSAGKPVHVIEVLLHASQVVTNRETQETLLCLACVFEVVTNTDGPKHRVYRLIKEN